MPAPVVVGLDISLTGTGIAGTDCDEKRGWSFSLGEKGKKDAKWPERFDRIDRAVAEIVPAVFSRSDYIGLLVVEGPAPSSNTGHVWDRAGVWHRVLWELAQRAVPVAVLTPNQRAKWATGRGNAGKGDVIEAMTRRYGHVWETFHGSDDECDAAALCAAGLWISGYPLAEVPESHSLTLAAVDWPVGSAQMAAAK